MNTINKILDKINLALATIAGIWLGFLLVAICTSTFSRFFLNKPISDLIEVSAYGLVFIAFLAAPYLLQYRSHINVDIIPNMLSRPNQLRLSLVTDVMGFLIAIVIAYVGFEATLYNYTGNIKAMDSMQTPMFLLLGSIPIGMFFLALQYIRNFIQELNELRGREAKR